MSNELRNRIIEIIRFTNRQVSSVPIYGSDEAADMILEVIGKRSNPSLEEQCLYTLNSEPTKPWFDMIPLSEEEKKRRIDDFPRRFKAAANAFGRKLTSRQCATCFDQPSPPVDCPSCHGTGDPCLNTDQT